MLAALVMLESAFVWTVCLQLECNQQSTVDLTFVKRFYAIKVDFSTSKPEEL